MSKIKHVKKDNKVLQPYKFHGISSTQWENTTGEVVCDCPWCNKPKFSINAETGKWQCFVCGEGSEKGGGNIYTFIRKLFEISDQETLGYLSLATDRALMPDTLIHWGVVQSFLTKHWLIPGYNQEEKLCQLYRFSEVKNRKILMPTPGLGHQMFGVPLLDKQKTIYVCEGPWDGMALWEAMSQCRESPDGLVITANRAKSLLRTAGVIAVPTCSVFSENWLPLFKGRTVVLMYDNDHPRINPRNNCTIPPAGWHGMQRVAGLLRGVAKEVRILQWGETDHNPELPSGYDIRDVLAENEHALTERLSRLLSLVKPVPKDWNTAHSQRANNNKSAELSCRSCHNYRTLTTAWRKALRWTDGLDRALSCMLACVASTRMVGDQLWLKIISPAASGKTTLAEAIAVDRKHIKAISTLRGMHSGFREEGGNSEDNSLLSLVFNKTLVIKDGDTLLKAPNLEQILSEMRDVYDGTSRTHYRNKASRDYEGIRLTVLLCGTGSLRQIDSSELGERFLDCVIMDAIDDDLEDEILERVVHRAARDVSCESNGEAIQHYPRELSEAMQLTGGYVEWLREHAAELLASVEYSQQVRRQITRLGKFVAFMRARPSLRQEEVAEREFATRLVSQLTRLAGCLTLVLNRTVVDSEVMRRVRQVAMDTARGKTMLMIDRLYREGEDGMESRAIAMLTGQTEDKTRGLLRFLREINCVENFQPIGERGGKGRVRWRLLRKMRRLYHEVHNVGSSIEE